LASQEPSSIDVDEKMDAEHNRENYLEEPVASGSHAYALSDPVGIINRVSFGFGATHCYVAPAPGCNNCVVLW
jgi:hypothetical protein